MARRFDYDYWVGYTATWASTFRLDKNQRMLHGPYPTLAEAVAQRHSMDDRERLQVYREMAPRGRSVE